MAKLAGSNMRSSLAVDAGQGSKPSNMRMDRNGTAASRARPGVVATVQLQSRSVIRHAFQTDARYHS